MTLDDEWADALKTPTDPPGLMALTLWPSKTRKDTTMTDTATTPVKPAYLTTEFYLSLATLLMGALYASGLVTAGTTWDKLAGLVTMLLAATGHTVSRTMLKGGA